MPDREAYRRDSPLAQFVGIDAYEAAGGAVLRDLFDDGNSGWFTDPPWSIASRRKSSTAKPHRYAAKVGNGRDHADCHGRC